MVSEVGVADPTVGALGIAGMTIVEPEVVPDPYGYWLEQSIALQATTR